MTNHSTDCALSCGHVRNIRTLYSFEPPVTDEEVRAAALQYVRKISGFTEPSKANAECFEHAVEAVAAVSRGCRTDSPLPRRQRTARPRRPRLAPAGNETRRLGAPPSFQRAPEPRPPRPAASPPMRSLPRIRWRKSHSAVVVELLGWL